MVRLPNSCTCFKSPFFDILHKKWNVLFVYLLAVILWNNRKKRTPLSPYTRFFCHVYLFGGSIYSSTQRCLSKRLYVYDVFFLRSIETKLRIIQKTKKDSIVVLCYETSGITNEEDFHSSNPAILLKPLALPHSLSFHPLFIPNLTNYLYM